MFEFQTAYKEIFDYSKTQVDKEIKRMNSFYLTNPKQFIQHSDNGANLDRILEEVSDLQLRDDRFKRIENKFENRDSEHVESILKLYSSPVSRLASNLPPPKESEVSQILTKFNIKFNLRQELEKKKKLIYTHVKNDPQSFLFYKHGYLQK